MAGLDDSTISAAVRNFEHDYFFQEENKWLRRHARWKGASHTGKVTTPKVEWVANLFNLARFIERSRTA